MKALMGAAATVAVLAIAAPASSVNASAVDVNFGTPAMTEGLHAITAQQRTAAIVLWWGEESSWDLAVTWDDPPQIKDHATASATAGADPAGPVSWQDALPDAQPSQRAAPGTYHVGPRGAGYLVLHVHGLSFEGGTSGTVDMVTAGSCAAATAAVWMRPDAMCLDADAARVTVQGPGALLTEVKAIEWHGVDVRCSATEGLCPDGGSTETRQAPGVDVSTRRAQTLRGDGTASLAGHPDILQFYGGAWDMRVHGAMRLPSAEVPECASCSSDKGATLRVSGDILLERVQPAADGRMTASMAGDLAAAAVDEASLDPKVLMPLLAAAGAVSLTAVLGWLGRLAVAALVHRHMTEGEVLENEARRQVQECVVARPGASMTEVAARTGLASGTVRHHLSVLTRYGFVVRRPHLNAHRYFENHGRYDRDWQTVNALRRRPQKRIASWVAQHPDCSQADIVRHAVDAWSWKRATAEYRIRCLEGEGVLTCRRRGRRKHYRLAPEASRTLAIQGPRTAG